MKKAAIFKTKDLADRKPEYALVGEVDLVVVRFDDEISVFYGRCLHRGALMSDGYVRGNDLICGVHDWDYRLDTGVSAYANEESCRSSNHGSTAMMFALTRMRSTHGAKTTRSHSTATPISGFMPTPAMARTKNPIPA